MKRLFTLLFGVFSICTTYGQSNRILGDFAFKNQVYTYEYIKEDTDIYSLLVSRSTKFSPSGADSTTADSDSTTKVIFDKFIKEEFVKVFSDQMKKKYNITDTTALNEIGTEVFFRVKARREFVNDNPLTAYLILKRDTIYSFSISKGLNQYRGNLRTFKLTHKIHDVEIETEDGTIKNITARLLKNRPILSNQITQRDFLIFKNLYPISISGKFDPERMADTYLYCLECGGITNVSRYVKLGDLAILDIIYENDKDDYSPANSKIHVSPQNPIEELRKERRSKIIEAAAFSDFLGLRNERPNGLIQFEVKRRFNLWTKHAPWNKESKIREASSLYAYEPYAIRNEPSLSSKPDYSNAVRLVTKSVQKGDSVRVAQYQYSTNLISSLPSLVDSSSLSFSVPKRRHNFTYYNWFGFVEFKLLFAKLEEKNKYLKITQKQDVRPIDLYRYQLINFGGQLNIVKLVFPQTKLTWNCLQVGLNWQSNSIIRSTDVSRDTLNFVSSAYYMLSTGVLFRPDGRFGASAGIDYIRPKIWEPSLVLENRGGLIRYSFDAYFKPNDNNRIFARARFTREITRNALDFAQIQIGYQFDIFQGVEDPKKFEP
ncbi:hypothetical protein [Spirosoma spitsbergense]|uniref:hypothetical protein n=1 Tax=Spirosoma spitsbergense TaxID=431554 RepID=UPI00037690EF|nr:hypothetical protein [Spirosoma spitsbergense]